ncbi:DUF4157 domain-containing protein [Pseudomonas sp. R5(2019)]|uniref:eCIS core domain-containing protein n=1 Tax=Pseudomonas sp. R5(2019) TaxID=2697566 RepID=UPI001C499399|nr:DUF4157 domain-containing protein [Pseudomonas sp. R5(2019)]
MQCKAADTKTAEVIPPIVDRVLSSPGHALDETTRSIMESRFRHDFSTVRLHTDREASESAESMHAWAYTVGRDVVLGTDTPPRSTSAGLHLLAHELAHVVQQSKGGMPPGVINDTTLEREADHAAYQVTNSLDAGAISATSPHLAMKPKGQRSDTAPKNVDVEAPLGNITLRVGGEVIATISYSAQAGQADVETWRGGGREGVTVVTPANSNAVYSLSASYAGRYQAGELVFEDVPADVAWEHVDGIAGGDVAMEQVGHTFRLVLYSVPVTRAERKAPLPAAARASAPRVKPKEAVFEAKAGDKLAKESSTLGFLDEERLAQSLLDQVRHDNLQAVVQGLDSIGLTNRDDVALAFCRRASQADLERLAESETGRKMLLRLYDELTSGHLGDDEKAQAERLMKARAQRINPENVLSADQRAPVIPFSSIGFTKFSSASLTARRLKNGKIWVKSHMKTEHWKEARRLPSNMFALGVEGAEFDPDDIVGLYLYDEGGKVVYVPALHLLQLGNQEDTKALTMVGEAVFTGLTMGVGGEVVAGTKAARGVWAARGVAAIKWADRGATAIGALSVLINDHRGLILKHFGSDGEAFLRTWQKIETVVAIYGIARGAVALGHVINDFRSTFGKWKARRAEFKNLNEGESAALDSVAAEAETALHDLESQHTKARSEPTPEPLAQSPSAGDHTPIAEPEPVSGGHYTQITREGIELCSGPPCPNFRVIYGEELNNNVALQRDLNAIDAMRRIAAKLEEAGKPDKALAQRVARRAAELQKKLEDARTGRTLAQTPPSGAVLGSPMPEGWADEALKKLQEPQPFQYAGDLVQLGPHGAASRNRAAIGDKGVNKESAHVAPQSVMKQVQGYKPEQALTRLLTRTQHRGKTGFDHFWKNDFDALRAARPDKQATAQEIYDIVARAIARTEEIPEGERLSLIARLSDEMFVEYGLDPSHLLDIPRGYRQ